MCLKRNNGGFSLVELIIVIAIMAILVAVVTPIYLKFVERSRKSTDCQTVAEIVRAVQVYSVDNTIDPSLQFDSGTEASPVTYTITLKPTEQTISATTTDKVLLAMKASGIEKYGLKSDKWNPNSDHSVTITFYFTENRGITFVQTSPAATSTLDIVAGKYN